VKPIEKARNSASKPWQSRLQVRAADVFRWRRSGVSYRAIAARLAEEGISVSHTAVASFVKARLPNTEKPRKAPVHPLVSPPLPPAKAGRLTLPIIAPTSRPEPETPKVPKKPFLDLSKIPEHLRPVSRDI